MANSNIWKDYFTFTKGERISVFILLSIILVSIFVPYFYRKSFAPPVVDSVLKKELNTLLQKDSATGNDVSADNNFEQSNQPAQSQLFYFDPNTLDAAGFSKLGLRDKTINTIINYRSKGGHFNEPEDIRKIYGLRTEEADRIIPYIGINSTNSDPVIGHKENVIEARPTINKIDINTATEEDFKALPGIGDVLSKRIVKFRNSINGFSSVNDISRTYGLPDSTFQLILPYLTISESNE